MTEYCPVYAPFFGALVRFLLKTGELASPRAERRLQFFIY